MFCFMVVNLSPDDIHNAMVQDFVDGWNALAKDKDVGARGNFKFGLQAMILLEFVGRLCSTSPSSFNAFLTELEGIEPRYFTRIPGLNRSFRYFVIPPGRQDQLLWALFDLIRNGQAHQYQSMVASLDGGNSLAITLTGARSGRYVRLGSAKRFVRHLGFRKERNGDVWITIYPNMVLTDFEEAIRRASILPTGLRFSYMANRYHFTSSTLVSSLVAAGHKKLRKG